ncbi:hypothetical protein FRC05_007858 [Tulasnella sp. 425]|nr:hypothetical protein FRC05_007858 [Tulasnella sp. 425]
MQFSSIFLAVVAAVGAFAQTTASVAQTTGPAAVADPTINTPSGVQQCLPVQLTFSGTAPPFIITIVPAGQAGAAPLETVGASNGTSLEAAPRVLTTETAIFAVHFKKTTLVVILTIPEVPFGAKFSLLGRFFAEPIKS